MTNRCSKLFWCAGLWLLSSLGCVTAPYQYGHFDSMPGDDEKLAEVVVDVGIPNKTLDRLGRVAGFPSRIFPLHAGVNNHEVSDETRDRLTNYLQENDLTDVRVRINHYDPADEWRRLRMNRRIAPFWRYTGGVLCYLHYTLLPSRVIGGDWYNPYSNSLYVNSDVQALVLHEAAYAKDIHSRRLPGTYSAINHVPLLWMWRQTVCVNDVLSYARSKEDWEIEEQTYRVVYPLIGAHAGMSFSPISPFGFEPLLGLGGALIGHATGRTVAAYRAAEASDSESHGQVVVAGYQESTQPKDKRKAGSIGVEHAAMSISHLPITVQQASMSDVFQ